MMMYLHLGLSDALIEKSRKLILVFVEFLTFLFLLTKKKEKEKCKKYRFCHFTLFSSAHCGFFGLSCLPHLIIIDTFLIFFIVVSC